MKYKLKCILALSMLCTLVGCMPTTHHDDPEIKMIDSRFPFQFEIVDDHGKVWQQELQHQPERVVVLGQGFAELMIHFGLEQSIVGMGYLDNSYSKYDQEINTLPLLTESWPSKESIIALQPDLIIGMSSAFIENRVGDISFWNERGIPVLTGINYTTGRTIESFYDDILNVGMVFDIEEQTQAYVNSEKEMIKKIETSKMNTEKKPNVLLFAGGENDVYYYYGPSLSLVDEMVEGSGGSYIEVSEQTFVTLTTESILKLNPDKIIITEFQKNNREAAKNLLMNNSTLQNLDAIKNEEILVVDYTNAVRGSLELVELYQEIFDFINDGIK